MNRKNNGHDQAWGVLNDRHLRQVVGGGEQLGEHFSLGFTPIKYADSREDHVVDWNKRQEILTRF